MKRNIIAISVAALISSLSASPIQTSPLDQDILAKENKKSRKSMKIGKLYKMGGKIKAKKSGPTPEEQKVLATIAKYPEVVANLLQEGLQNKQADQTISWAKKVSENLSDIKEQGIHFGGSEKSDVTVLMIVDFLCPHCQTHLKMISDIRKKNANIKFIVYSVPLFQGDLTREYGLILNAAYRKDATKFLSLLGAYPEAENSKEGLLKKVKEFKIDIAETDYNDLSAYDKNASIMDKIGLTQVPVSFALVSDNKNGTIVVPLNIMSADSLVGTVSALEETSSKDRAKIKESFGQ